MPDKKLKRLNVLRFICYSFFLLICGMGIMDSFFSDYFNWLIITITIALSLQVIFGVKVMDLVVGVILVLLAGYMLLAVTSDLVDHYNGTKRFQDMSRFRVYFGFGYGVFGIALLGAIGIILTAIARLNIGLKESNTGSI